MTEQQALSRLTTLCSRAEHCSGDMLKKMREWKLTDEEQARIMERLTRQKYVDDERFCRAFVSDKVKYDKWGRRKIEHALYIKGVTRDIFTPILNGVDDEDYLVPLRQIIKDKLKSTRANSDYERSMKVIKYAMSRGFELNLVRKCVDEAIDMDDE